MMSLTPSWQPVVAPGIARLEPAVGGDRLLGLSGLPPAALHHLTRSNPGLADLTLLVCSTGETDVGVRDQAGHTNAGSAGRIRCKGVTLSTDNFHETFARGGRLKKLPLVSITLFGRPVMPDEYGWNVTSSFDDCAPDRRRERPPRRIDVVDDVFDFGPGEAPADVDAHCVQERCSKEHLEVLDADVVDERHPVLRPGTVGGEPLSDLRRSDGELAN